MRTVVTFLSTVGVIGLVCGNWTAGVGADARAHQTQLGSSPSLPRWLPPLSSRAQQQAVGNAAAPPPSAALFKQYCVGCHNDRMKGNFGNLSLESVDPADVSGHVETLEKVVRKLRKGLMPPDGRPRPDARDARHLHRVARKRPRSRRRTSTQSGSRGLTPVESHGIRQRHSRSAGLDVNGAELLPSDMAGFGFDNNADVLSITPGLMARYITAATKISRRRAGDSGQSARDRCQYKVEIGTRQDARMGEDMPFATFGGLAVKHTFPLDGEYAFQLRLTRDQDGLINGIMDEHQIELRVDRELVKRFTIGGQFKEPDAGPADCRPRRRRPRDEGPQLLHQRRQGLDGSHADQSRHADGDGGVSSNRSRFRQMPGARGGRGGAAHWWRRRRHRWTCCRFRAVQRDEDRRDTPAGRRSSSAIRRAPATKSRARGRSSTTLARRAYRGSRRNADVDQLLAIYKKAAPAAISTPASSARSKRCCRRRSS